MDLQKAGASERGLEGVELVHYSRYYRSALHECVIALKKKAMGESTRDSMCDQTFGNFKFVSHLSLS